MPIYEYLCANGHRFERRPANHRRARRRSCEVCGKPVQRVLHAPAIHFKGKGFYSTDYGRGKGANGAKPERRRVGVRLKEQRRHPPSGGCEVGLEELRVEELRLQELGLEELGRRRLLVQEDATASRSELCAPARRSQVQPAPNVSPRRGRSGADLPSTARMTRRFSSPPMSSLRRRPW